MISQVVGSLAETTETVIAFALFFFCYILGVHRERGRKPKPEVKPKPSLRCGCQHELSYHDGLGQCWNVVRTGVHDRAGRPLKKDGEYVVKETACGCKQYTGDLPEDWFARDSMRELYTAPQPVVGEEEK